jgi:hypothetical protein
MLGAMAGKHIERRADGRRDMTDGELKAFLTEAMIEAGATAAAIYAYHRTDVILTSDNEHRLPPERLRAWNAAINEYYRLTAGPKQ